MVEMRKNDDRYTPEYGLLALTPEGTVAAGHFLMQIPTETVNAELDIGGANAVATRPDYSRRGTMSMVIPLPQT
jgi:hypothetical protein